MLLRPHSRWLQGWIDHYILAPFARTQEKMNRLFLGTEWSLAERYSDMSKSIFIALSFAAIYPSVMSTISALCLHLVRKSQPMTSLE